MTTDTEGLTEDRIVDLPRADSDEALLNRARDRYEEASNFWRPIYDEGRKDWRFASGDQWDERARAARLSRGKPVLTMNMLPGIVRRVLGEWRKFRPGIKLSAIDPGAPKVANLDGTNDYSLAQVFEGAARDVERASAAEDCYDWAFECMATGGVGFVRLLTEYSPHGLSTQQARLRAIANPFNVLLDPLALLEGPEAAQYGFILTAMREKAFREKYPQARSSGFGQAENTYGGWYFPDGSVFVAEYFEVVQRAATVYVTDSGRVYEAEEGIERRLASQGETVIDAQERRLPLVKWQVLTDTEVLTDRKDFPGRYIPIIPMFGYRTVVDGETMVESLIRHSRDPQQSKNYFESSLAEHAQQSPKAPYIASTRAVKGRNKKEWERAHLDPPAVLTYDDHDGTAPAPTRAAPPEIPDALVERVQSADEAIYHTTLGKSPAELQPSSESGRKFMARQIDGDDVIFPLYDNARRGIRYAGVLLTDLIPRVVTSQAIVRLHTPEGTDDYVQVNIPYVEYQDGRLQYGTHHDLALGRFDVAAETGPGVKTQRHLATEQMLNILGAAGADPEAARIMLPMLVRNLDAPGSDELARQLSKLVPPQHQDTGPEDEQELPPQLLALVQQLVQQGVAQQVQELALDLEQARTQADMAKAEADMIKAQTEAAMEPLVKQIEQLTALQRLQNERNEAGAAPLEIDFRDLL